MKRTFDLFFAFTLSFVFLIPFFVVFVLVKITSKGPAFYFSRRVGKDNILFKMPKFRTMRIETPVVATHLLNNPDEYLTPVGKFLRTSSLDEIPQLLTIISGKMSFVGPRPALFNQDDLIELRTKESIHKITPGLTGWAQVNGRDEISISEKVILDKYYFDKRSILFDVKIIALTFLKVIFKKDIIH
jgi:O-antigen biosynthesis protein WbqP